MSELSWVEKYRPKKLNEMVLDEKIREVMQGFIDKGTIGNFLLAGRAGLGKTVLARVLVNELNATLLYVNASVENNVDMVRTKIKDFCDSVALDGIKIVILDESDALTGSGNGGGPGGGSSAQAALRNIIEEASDDTRFILTCNYLNKIIEPIQSRCTPIKLKFTVNDVLKRCIEILSKEKIKFDEDSLVEFSQEIIKKKMPDIRTIINCLEQWSINGTLENKGTTDAGQIDKILDFIFQEKNARKIREYLIQHEDLFSSDYEMLMSELFGKYDEDGKKQLMIAECLYRQAICLDKEVQAAACIIQLKG